MTKNNIKKWLALINKCLLYYQVLVNLWQQNMFLNDEPCMVKTTLIGLNPDELKYYPSMISLVKCGGSCNVSSPKICVPKETKKTNVKLFIMIPNKNEAKVMAKHTSCDCKCKFNSITCNANQKRNNKTCQC